MPQYDLIMPLGGGVNNDGSLTELSKQRLEFAANLYKQGIANKLTTTGEYYPTWSPRAIRFDITGADLRANYLVELGVKSEDIIRVHSARDTITEAFGIRETIKNLGFKKLLLVTSDKHMDRALYIFQRILGPNYAIDNMTVPCGDILNSDEEKDYLEAIKKLFASLPPDIPNPASWESWYQDHLDFYDDYTHIHAKYMKDATETNQAYMGVEPD